jgi:hypothetical protein
MQISVSILWKSPEIKLYLNWMKGNKCSIKRSRAKWDEATQSKSVNNDVICLSADHYRKSKATLRIVRILVTVAEPNKTVIGPAPFKTANIHLKRCNKFQPFKKIKTFHSYRVRFLNNGGPLEAKLRTRFCPSPQFWGGISFRQFKGEQIIKGL